MYLQLANVYKKTIIKQSEIKIIMYIKNVINVNFLL